MARGSGGVLGFRTLAALAGLVLLTAFTLDADAGKRKPVKARVTASFQVAEPVHVIIGDLDSRKKECFRHRVVDLYRNGVAASQDVTDRQGRFEVSTGSNSLENEYQVQARRRKVLNRGNPRPPVVCKRVVSETITAG
jgi:hypothetical protein